MDVQALNTDPSIAKRSPFTGIFNEDAPLLAGSALHVPNAHLYPEVHPYWARRGDDEIIKAQTGYIYPTSEQAKLLGTPSNTPDGKVYRGPDMVLMICSTDRFRRVERDVVERTNEQVNGHATRIKRDIAQSNLHGGKADGEIVTT